MRMPFSRASSLKYEPQSQAAIARWMLVFCADTPIISLPRQAIGRT